MFTLHDYQKLAVAFLQEQPRAGLFLDMGLGKTAITLSALTEEHLPALVVAPKRVVDHVWEPEQKLWRPDLTISLANGSPTQRAEALTSNSDIAVISRDNMGQAAELAIKGDVQFRTLILDELSSWKNRSTERWKFARQLSLRSKYCWGLTGTPAPNGLLDLWAQIALLDQGERLGKNITAYRNRYFYPGRQLANGTIIEWNLRPEAEEHIHSLISDICLSLEPVELPPTYNPVPVSMPTSLRKMYKEFKRDLVLDLDLLGGEIHSASSAASLTNRLSQMTAGFMYVDNADLRGAKYDEIHQEKIKALQEIIDGTGSPVLVFYHYKAELEMIRRAIPSARHIDEKGCIEAWNRGEVPVMLAQPASAGIGLNLQAGGHTIVWTTLDWSLEIWLQANKRIARQGQEHHVTVHILEMEDSIDAVVRHRLTSKKFTQDKLLEHLEAPL